MFNPINKDKLDSARIVKYTTWNPQTGPVLSLATPFTAEQMADNAEEEDRIDLVFTAAMWQYRKPEVHIGIYNSHANGEPVSFSIQMREKSCINCLVDDIRQRNEVFNLVHEGTDAHLTSDQERAEKDLHW